MEDYTTPDRVVSEDTINEWCQKMQSTNNLQAASLVRQTTIKEIKDEYKVQSRRGSSSCSSSCCFHSSWPSISGFYAINAAPGGHCFTPLTQLQNSRLVSLL
jgi:hypothetical protein